MAIHFNDLSPGRPPDYEERLQQVIDFWNAFSCLEDAGETTWGVLEEIQSAVSECLARDPVDLERVESLTANAALLISGKFLF
jgi:hypothetical protein